MRKFGGGRQCLLKIEFVKSLHVTIGQLNKALSSDVCDSDSHWPWEDPTAVSVTSILSSDYKASIPF